ncbi:MAG: hypothetical protein U9R06_02135, partial [Patescibacteria group bacterium]|nr:hypothetical protein [Patescibacteria group bacterium]
YNGKTQNLIHESGTANFAYMPFLNLSIGEHTAWAIAENESGRKSQISNILKFRIEEPMPTPTLFTPIANDQTTHNRPFVVGLAKNNSLIKVYIDHQLNGEFKVKNHKSGTANFAYKPFVSLSNGGHLLYAEAVDSRGKISLWSNIIYFNIAHTVQPAIASKDVEKTEKIEVLSENLQAEKQTQADEKKEKISGDAENIKEFLQQEDGETAEKTGSINESKEPQGKLQLNLIIFIVFLIAVIAWIFWVNRELIKERRAQAKKTEKDKTDKSAPPTTQDIEKNDKNDLPPPYQEQPPLV